MIILIWTVVTLSSLYLYLRETYSKFKRLGVNHLPVVPLLGNTASIVLKREHMIYNMERGYKRYPDDKIIGFYEFMTPIFMINDVELVKKITIKDFNHFVDRRNFPEEFQNSLFTNNLLALKEEKWKAMRLTLSPAFTQSKIRLMVPFMIEISDLTIKHLRKKINESGAGYVDVEAKDLCARHLNDLLASCVYGIKVSSMEGDNELYTKCKNASHFSVWEFTKTLFIRNFPKTSRLLNITMKADLSKFFYKLVLEMMKQRDQQDTVRNDMIHILKEAKKEWSDEYLVPQAVLFFLAGFETVSTAMAFLLYELALHPEVQNKLYREIRLNNENNNGQFEYSSIMTLTYLDMVISESLRLWPPALFIERTCVKDYNLRKPNDQAKTDVIIRRNAVIQLPVWSFHRNPKFFPEPEKFDPERFSAANKHSIKPFTYMPFGVGPRNCIGSRFALSKIKVLMYKLLLNIEVEPSCSAHIPPRLAVNSIFPRIEGGHWVRMKLRNT